MWADKSLRCRGSGGSVTDDHKVAGNAKWTQFMKAAGPILMLVMFAFAGFVSAQEWYVATGMTNDKHSDATLYEDAYYPSMCVLERMDILFKRGGHVKLDPKTGVPESCLKARLATLPHGTKVREITPPGPCKTEKKGEYRRVRVLTGDDKDKVGCIYEGLLASEPLP